MDTKSYELTLPPLKRYRLHQHRIQIHNDESKSPQKPILPAKKRKHSRIPPSSPPSLFNLPAKKRIWAIPPFDLNLEPQEKSPQKIDDKVEETVVDNDADDGIICDICQSADGDAQDPIVLCDGCDVMVHCSCYGHPLNKGVPEGDWFCQQCLSQKQSKSLTDAKCCCCLCPVSGGAMKATKDGKWAHVVCSLFVPEVFFEDSEGREGIDCSMVPMGRFEGLCYLCETKNGCVLDCSEMKCGLSFHVMCGVKEDLCVEYQQGKKKSDVVAGFCRKHTDLWQKQQQTGKYKIVAKD